MPANQNKTHPKGTPEASFTYLALGDSYTLGEGVVAEESFPYQLVRELQNVSLGFSPPRVIAQTGWTSQELYGGIEAAGISGEKYDLVTLMIGVNNQYRKERLRDFKTKFPSLLDLSIGFAYGGATSLILISIPDWGITPFAQNREQSPEIISGEIDRFNEYIKKTAIQKKVHFLDVTEEYRQIGFLSHNLLPDQLHPTASVYKNWALALQKLIVSEIGFHKNRINRKG